MLVRRQTELIWAHSLKQKGGRGAVLNSGLREASERLSFPPELPNIRQKPRTQVCRPWDLIFQVQKSRTSDIWIKEVKGKLRPAGQCGPCLSGRKSPYPSSTKLDRPPWKARRGSSRYTDPSTLGSSGRKNNCKRLKYTFLVDQTASCNFSWAVI